MGKKRVRKICGGKKKDYLCGPEGGREIER
jgi:hypothetical protein